MPDHHITRPAADKDPAVAPKIIIRAIGHVLEGVVGESQVGDCLVTRLPPITASSIGLNAAAEAGFPYYDPDACLINRYIAGARLGLHQDRDEKDAWAPIVSVSLGLPAVFLWGGKSRSDPLRRRNDVRWRFNGSWSVRLHTSGFHTNHVHPRGWISSACYIELPDGMSDARTQDGVLTFGEPGIATTPVLSAEYSVRPSVGLLVLFPSYFWHGTVPFRSSQARPRSVEQCSTGTSEGGCPHVACGDAFCGA